MKKILIFGLPRTGTTVLQKYLEKSLNIKNYSEPFSDSDYRNSIGDPYRWASVLPNGIIKVLSQNLDYIDLEKLITAGNFDYVIVTRRTNLTDLIISLYYAEQISQQYHYTTPVDSVSPFVFPLDFIEKVMIPYRWYQTTLDNLNKKSIPYSVFDYDQYLTGTSQTVADIHFCLEDVTRYKIKTVSAGIQYDQLCLNYIEVKNAIDLIINENNH